MTAAPWQDDDSDEEVIEDAPTSESAASRFVLDEAADQRYVADLRRSVYELLISGRSALAESYQDGGVDLANHDAQPLAQREEAP